MVSFKSKHLIFVCAILAVNSMGYGQDGSGRGSTMMDPLSDALPVVAIEAEKDPFALPDGDKSTQTIGNDINLKSQFKDYDPLGATQEIGSLNQSQSTPEHNTTLQTTSQGAQTDYGELNTSSLIDTRLGNLDRGIKGYKQYTDEEAKKNNIDTATENTGKAVNSLIQNLDDPSQVRTARASRFQPTTTDQPIDTTFGE